MKISKKAKVAGIAIASIISITGFAKVALAWTWYEHVVGNVTGVNLTNLSQTEANQRCQTNVRWTILNAGGTFTDYSHGGNVSFSHGTLASHIWAHRQLNTCVVNAHTLYIH
jgi:hypothetical protein